MRGDEGGGCRATCKCGSFWKMPSVRELALETAKVRVNQQPLVGGWDRLSRRKLGGQMEAATLRQARDPAPPQGCCTKAASDHTRQRAWLWRREKLRSSLFLVTSRPRPLNCTGCLWAAGPLGR